MKPKAITRRGFLAKSGLVLGTAALAPFLPSQFPAPRHAAAAPLLLK